MDELLIHNSLLEGRKVISRVTFPRSLEKFLLKDSFFIEFDTDLYSDQSILNVPVTATVLAFAWVSGSNIRVETLDRRFKDSMEILQEEFKKMLPLAPFKTQILVEEIVDNENILEDPEKGLAQLFSGGIDSTYTLLTHLEEKPRMITYWGVERTPYPIYKQYWEKVKSTYDKFALQNELNHHLIKTDVLELLDRKKIEHEYHKELFYGNIWSRLMHGLVLISLNAPMSITRYNKLLIPASNSPVHPKVGKKYYPHSQIPHLDEKIVWSNIDVEHDGYVQRSVKTRTIGQYDKDRIMLRVCLERKKAPSKFNCSDCAKCYRTIAQLLLVGMDPNEYGFNVDNMTMDKMKDFFIKNGLGSHDLDTQDKIPDKIDRDLYGSKKFFEWLKGYKGKKTNKRLYRKIYFTLPYLPAQVFDKLMKNMNIQLHEGTPGLSEKTIQELEVLIEEKNLNSRH